MKSWLLYRLFIFLSISENEKGPLCNQNDPRLG